MWSNYPRCWYLTIPKKLSEFNLNSDLFRRNPMKKIQPLTNVVSVHIVQQDHPPCASWFPHVSWPRESCHGTSRRRARSAVGSCAPTTSVHTSWNLSLPQDSAWYFVAGWPLRPCCCDLLCLLPNGAMVVGPVLNQNTCGIASSVAIFLDASIYFVVADQRVALLLSRKLFTRAPFFFWRFAACCPFPVLLQSLALRDPNALTSPSSLRRFLNHCVIITSAVVTHD